MFDTSTNRPVAQPVPDYLQPSRSRTWIAPGHVCASQPVLTAHCDERRIGVIAVDSAFASFQSWCAYTARGRRSMRRLLPIAIRRSRYPKSCPRRRHPVFNGPVSDVEHREQADGRRCRLGSTCPAASRPAGLPRTLLGSARSRTSPPIEAIARGFEQRIAGAKESIRLDFDSKTRPSGATHNRLSYVARPFIQRHSRAASGRPAGVNRITVARCVGRRPAHLLDCVAYTGTRHFSGQALSWPCWDC